MIQSQVNFLRAVAGTEFLNGFIGGVFAAIGIHESFDGVANLLGRCLHVSEGFVVMRHHGRGLVRRLIRIGGNVC